MLPPSPVPQQAFASPAGLPRQFSSYFQLAFCWNYYGYHTESMDDGASEGADSAEGQDICPRAGAKVSAREFSHWLST